MSAVEPVNEFILDADLNEDATFTHIGGSGSASIKVIFDSRTEEVQDGAESFLMPKLEALARTTDVSTAVVNDTLVVASVTYYVTQVLPDGTGITRLLLSRDQV